MLSPPCSQYERDEAVASSLKESMAAAVAAGASPQYALMEAARMELAKLRGELSSEELKVS